MKQVLIVCALLLTSLFAHSQVGVDLTLTSPAAPIVVVCNPLLPKFPNDRVVKYAQLSNGKTHIDIPQDRAYVVAILVGDDITKVNSTKYIEFYYFPEDKLEVYGDLVTDGYNDMVIKGGFYDEFFAKALPTYFELDKRYWELLKASRANSQSADGGAVDIAFRMRSNNEKINIAKKFYILNNPTSEVSAMFMIHITPVAPEFLTLYSHLDDSVKSGKFKELLSIYVQIAEQMEATRNNNPNNNNK